jgi:hypothetical protein
MKALFTPIFLICLSFLCYSQDTMKAGCLVVEKEAIMKNGQPTGRMEMYLRCSVDDYYIKFCESKVTRKELEPYLENGVSVEMEIRDGYWDICPGYPQEMASRVGKYVVIFEILK